MVELTGIALLRTIIPDEFAERLCLIAPNWRKDKFAIGDIRNSLKAIVEERMLPVAVTDIDDFLAECLLQEVEPRTIRYYAMIADSFPEPTRAQYSYLPFTHFAFAHSLERDKWDEVLKLSRDRTQNSGKVPSLAWLKAALSGYIYERQSGDFPSISDDEAVFSTQEGKTFDTSQAEDKKTGWLAGLHKAVEFAISHIDALPIESDKRNELLELLCKVESITGQYIMV